MLMCKYAGKCWECMKSFIKQCVSYVFVSCLSGSCFELFAYYGPVGVFIALCKLQTQNLLCRLKANHCFYCRKLSPLPFPVLAFLTTGVWNNRYTFNGFSLSCCLLSVSNKVVKWPLNCGKIQATSTESVSSVNWGQKQLKLTELRFFEGI